MIFKERTEAPLKSNKYYGRPDPFINAGYGMFQNNGNCVDYAWCRFRESQENMKASEKLPTSNAGGWLEKAKANGFKTGKKAKLGAIVVYKKKGTKSNEGHVAFVEKIGSKIRYSSSGWKSYIWKRKELKDGSNWSSTLIFQGYIYPDVNFDNWEIGDYKVLYNKYLRTSPEVKATNKAKYNNLSSTAKTKCIKDKLGYAKYKIGATINIKEFKYDNKGNLWGRTSTLWVCVNDSSGEQVVKI